MTIRVVVAEIPIVTDVIQNAVDTAGGWAWDKVTAGISSWILGAVGELVDGSLNFLKTAAHPNVEAAWFSGANSPYATVRNLAGVLLLAFVFLAIIQGLLAGDTTGMIRRVAADLPTAIIGMVVTVTVVAKLVELTDSLSTGVLAQSDGQALHFVSGFGTAVTAGTNGFAAVIVGLVAVIAALMLWIELMVRSVLVYLLVALCPLGFAAMVWPAAKGVVRKMIELLVAVIVSKLVVCIALSIGVAALSGAGTPTPGAGVGDGSAQGLGGLLVGTAILGLAAFSPFLVLKLMPLAEAALIAQGVSRSPVRAAQSAGTNAYHVQALGRLAGGASGRSAGGSAGWVSGAGTGAGGAAGGAAGALGPAGAVAVAGTKTVGAVGRRARESVEQTSTPPSATTSQAQGHSTARDATRSTTPKPARKPDRPDGPAGSGPGPRR